MARQTCIRCYGALFSKFIGLAAISSAVLLSACGEDSLPADDPLLRDYSLDVPVAYIKRPVAQLHDPRDPVGPLPDNDPADGDDPGGNLYLRDYASATSIEVNLTSAYTAITATKGAGDVSDLDVSYDGTQVVFAMHEGQLVDQTAVPQNTWNIWIYDQTDGSITRAIPSPEFDNEANLGNDIDPMFLPDGRIVFASDRKPRSYEILLEQDGEAPPTLLTNEADINAATYNLHIMTPGDNPNNIKQLTFNRSNDLNPTLLRDGRIAYMRWDNANGRDHLNLSHIRPDGTEYNLLYGAHSYTTTERVLYESREAPNGRLLSVKMPSDGTFLGGKLVYLDQDNFVELNTIRAGGSSSSSSAESSASKSSVSEGPGISRGGRFTTPFPLWDGSSRALVSWAWCEVVETDGDIVPCTDNNTNLPAAAPKYGLWMMDLSDFTTTPIDLGTRGLAMTDPVALIDRFSAGNAPTSLTDKTSGAGFDSVLEGAAVGLLKIRSVYDTDNILLIANTGTNLTTIMNTPADQRLIRFVRITKPAPVNNKNNVDNSDWRQIFGYQEVEPDGSVIVQVPAEQPFGIELLDQYGRRLRADTSWLQVLPGETVQCNGCHSSRTSNTPLNTGSPNGTAFTGTNNTSVAAIIPQMGETMAETRARVDGCSSTNMNCSYVRLKGDLVYDDDVWNDPENTDMTNDVRSINVAYADLDTASPVDPGCGNPANWSAATNQYCWITIQYETHIHPLWEKERPQVDAMGQPIYNIAGDPTSGQLNYKCVLCHTEVDPADSNGNTAIDPAGQLTLTADGLNKTFNNSALSNSYLELVNNDFVQMVNNGVLEYQLVNVSVTDNTVDPPVTTIEQRRVPLRDSNVAIPPEPLSANPQTDGTSAAGRPVRPNDNFLIRNNAGDLVPQNDGPFLTKMIKGHSNNGDTSKFEFDGNAFGATIDHSGMMTDAELRLMIEWIDTGARYSSDPFVP